MVMLKSLMADLLEIMKRLHVYICFFYLYAEDAEDAADLPSSHKTHLSAIIWSLISSGGVISRLLKFHLQTLAVLPSTHVNTA